MVLTPSTMVALGTPMPAFRLPDTDGVAVDSAGLDGPVLVMFICNHCPYIKHIADQLGPVAAQVEAMGVRVVAINSNDIVNYPEDAPDKMVQEKQRRGWAFPYLFDATQEVARAFDAQCTPDLFLYDADHRLAYRGQFDGSRPGNEVPVTGDSILAAARAVVGAGDMPEQVPSIGCNIKWQ